jgi:hypothetical protein
MSGKYSVYLWLLLGAAPGHVTIYTYTQGVDSVLAG